VELLAFTKVTWCYPAASLCQALPKALPPNSGALSLKYTDASDWPVRSFANPSLHLGKESRATLGVAGNSRKCRMTAQSEEIDSRGMLVDITLFWRPRLCMLARMRKFFAVELPEL